MKKTVISLLLCFVLLFACCAPAFAEETQPLVCENAAAVMRFVIVERGNTVPIRIAPAVLATDNGETPVYVVGLLGVKSVKGQENNVKNCILAAFNRANGYRDLIKETIFAEIPAGSALVFACHSLGGMVAQQLRTDADLAEAYEIVNVMTAGSPYIMVNGDGEGALNRLIDKFDVIPLLSPATVLAPQKQFREAAREDGGYAFDPDGAHNLSYLRDEIWGAYDALGVKDGGAVLRIDAAAARTFGAVETNG